MSKGFAMLLRFSLLSVAIGVASSTPTKDSSSIPPLLLGRAVPVMSINDLLSCPLLQPLARAPTETDNPTKVYFTLAIEKLLNIDDIDQTISISATLNMQWGVYECPADSTASKIDQPERIGVLDPTSVWNPTVIFANSSNDLYMEGDQFEGDMQIMYLPTRVNRTLYFYWARRGILTAKCSLNLRNFPFDSQTCDFMFLMKEPSEFLIFADVHLKEPTMSPNEPWRLVSTSTTTGMTSSTIIVDSQSNYVNFRVSFDRNPFYHVNNLLAPCYVLIVLIFASFAMPPDKPDRPVICCTILLAFIVTQSDVLKEVPHTSESILLAEYILLFTGLAAFVTTHDMIMCELAKWPRFNRRIDVALFGRFTFNIHAIRSLDVICFLLSLGFLFIINLYAFVVIVS